MPPKIKSSRKTNTQLKKRKREEFQDRSHNKKQKVEDESPSKKTSILLPNDCWKTILSFLDDQTVPLMLVSKQLMKLCCEIINVKFASIFDISVKDASLVPNEVKRIASHIDIYVLLEMALDKARSKNNDGLMEVLQRLHRLANMQTYLYAKSDYMRTKKHHPKARPYSRIDPYFDYLDRDLEALSNQKIYYLDMNLDYLSLYDCTDSCIWDWISDAKFVWFGKNGRFAQVDLQYHETHIHVECGNWFDFNFTFILKQIGSEESKTVKFSYNADAATTTTFDNGEWVEDPNINHSVFEQVIEWLQLDVDVDSFQDMLKTVIEESKSVPHVDAGQCYSQEKGDEWNGHINEELERVMQMFTRNEKNWASEIEFVTTVIISKLTILDRIRNASKLSEKAREEFIELVDKAKIEYGFMQDRVFHQPKGDYVKEGTLRLHLDQFKLKFLKDDDKVATMYISELGGVPSSDDLQTDEYCDYCHVRIIFPTDSKKKRNDRFSITTDEDKKKLIDALQLKHIATVEDLNYVIDALRAEPGENYFTEESGNLG